MFELLDGRASAFQWDTGLYIDCTGLKETDQVHFCRPGQVLAIHPALQGEKLAAPVPDELLQRPEYIRILAYATTDTGEHTTYECRLSVTSRPKPPGYVYTPAEVLSFKRLEKELEARVNDFLEQGGASDEQIAAAVEAYLDENPVEVSDVVKTVNGVAPDENGNVDIAGNDGFVNLKKYGIVAADYAEPFTEDMYHVAYANGVGIQRAIDDAIAVGQKDVILPPGNYPLCYYASAKDDHNPIINACGVNLYGYGVKLYVIYDESGTNPYYTWTDTEKEANGGSQNNWILMGTVIHTDSDVEGFEIVGERAYRKHENTPYRDSSCGIRIDTWASGNTIKNCKIHHVSGDGIGNGMTLNNVYVSGDIECTPGTVVGGVVTENAGEGLLSPRMRISASVDMTKPIIMASTGYQYFLWTKKVPLIHCFDSGENYIGSVRNNQSEPFMAPDGTYSVRVELYMGSSDTTSYTAVFRFGNATYQNTVIDSCESYLNQRGGMSNLPTGSVVRKCKIHDNGGAYGDMVAYYDGTQFGVDIEDWYIHNIVFEKCLFYGQLHDILFRCNKITVDGTTCLGVVKSLNYATDVILKDSRFYADVTLVEPAQFGVKRSVGCEFYANVAPEIQILDDNTSDTMDTAVPVGAVINETRRKQLDFLDVSGNILFSADMTFFGKKLGEAVFEDDLLFDLDLTKATSDNLTISDETGNLSATVASADAIAENGVCVYAGYTNIVNCTWVNTPSFNTEFAVELFCFGFPSMAISNNSYKSLIRHQNQAGLGLPTTETATSSTFANIMSDAPYTNTSGETIYGSTGKTNGYIILDDGSEVYGNEVNVPDIKTKKYSHIVFNFESSGIITIYCNGYPVVHTITTTDFAAWDLSTFMNSFIMFRGRQNTSHILKSARMYNRCLTKSEVRNNLKFEAAKLGL